MDWQERLISLFVYTCNHYEDYLWSDCQRLSNNDHPPFSDSEVIVIYLWGVIRGYQEIRDIYDYTQDHLGDWFPKLPAYAT